MCAEQRSGGSQRSPGCAEWPDAGAVLQDGVLRVWINLNRLGPMEAEQARTAFVDAARKRVRRGGLPT